MSNRFELGVALFDDLAYTSPIGLELRKQVFESYKAEHLAEAVRYGRELYQIGAQAGDIFAQGAAAHYLGVIFLGLGARSDDLDKATEYFRQGAQLFNGLLSHGNVCDEGIAWLGVGEACAHQWPDFYKDRWEPAIDAFAKAVSVFKRNQHRLTTPAEDRLRQTQIKFADWVKATNKARDFATHPPAPKENRTAEANALLGQPFAPADSNQFANYGRSNFRHVFIAIFIVEGLAILVASHSAFFYFVWRVPEFTNYFIVGYFLGWLGLVVPLIGLLAARQLTYHIPRGWVALSNDHGRIWQIEIPGRHWLMPFSEYLIGVIPRSSKKLQVFRREFATQTGLRVSTQTQVHLEIVDAARAWSVIGATLKPARVMGIPKPLREKEIIVPIEQSARDLINGIIGQIAGDPLTCALFDAESAQPLEECTRKLLTPYCNWLGLRLTALAIKIYKT